MKLGNNLKKCRFENGEISQDYLAKQIGVSRQTINSIEKAKYVPSTLLALKLAQFFQLKVEEIFFLIQNDK